MKTSTLLVGLVAALARQVTCDSSSDSVQATASSDITPTTTTTNTATSSPLGPSPSAYVIWGCVREHPSAPWVLQHQITPSGTLLNDTSNLTTSALGNDTDLTIPKCKNACYLLSFPFIGVKEGNQCWCGDAIGGGKAYIAPNPKQQCNVPCSGDVKTMCGGRGFINFFGASNGTEDVVMGKQPESSRAVTSGAGRGVGRLWWMALGVAVMGMWL